MCTKEIELKLKLNKTALIVGRHNIIIENKHMLKWVCSRTLLVTPILIAIAVMRHCGHVQRMVSIPRYFLDVTSICALS